MRDDTQKRALFSQMGKNLYYNVCVLQLHVSILGKPCSRIMCWALFYISHYTCSFSFPDIISPSARACVCVCVGGRVCPQRAYHSKAEDIRLWCDLSSEGLGRHVRTGTHDPLRHHGRWCPFGRCSRQPKVWDLCHKFFIQQDVCTKRKKKKKRFVTTFWILLTRRTLFV